MCGYIGQISNNRINQSKLDTQNKDIICRGPDEKQVINGNFSQFNSNSELNFSFIFNRLSIIDLSNSASQPMFSKEFNSLIMFNGEIYNHQKLRVNLENEGVKFYSDHSDTEVLLLGLSKHGPKFLDNVIGQFAITFFNFNNNRGYLIRDRLGQKPLFYSLQNNNFLFSSNLKSLANMHDDISVNDHSVAEYVKFGYISSPNTIFKNIYKLKPAEIIEFKFDKNIEVDSKKIYWKIDDFVNDKKFEKDTFYEKFLEAVEIRRIADVKVAALLSGGIDSTSIVKALSNSSEPVNTFSIGYEDLKYDEQLWSSKVVKKYDTNHISEIITNSELENYIDETINNLDEPYADPSTVPSYVISRKISNYYKVALTGDGGDELLCGYKRIQQIQNLKKLNSKTINQVYNLYPWFFGTGNNLQKYSKDLNKNYQSYFSDSKFFDSINKKIKIEVQADSRFFNLPLESLKDFMLVDYKLFLSEMMMYKVDRMSMANSLEARSPFIDHKLIEYCINSNLDFLSGSPKSILKEYLSNDFDNQFLNRKKMGFVFNLEKWIYENLDYIKNYLWSNHSYLGSFNMINNLTIRKSRINAQRIWKVFVLEKYLNDYFKERSS